MALHRQDIEIGQYKCGYKILKELGQGSFSVVYLALDQENQSVAIKLPKLDPTKSHARSRRGPLPTNMVLEAVLSASLRHPCVIRTLEAFVDPDAPDSVIIVQEVASGGTG